MALKSCMTKSVLFKRERVNIDSFITELNLYFPKFAVDFWILVQLLSAQPCSCHLNKSCTQIFFPPVEITPSLANKKMLFLCQ